VTSGINWHVAAECEAAGVRLGTSESEAMVLCRKLVDCSLHVGTECLPQAKEFKYLGVLFTSEGKMEQENRPIGATAAVKSGLCQIHCFDHNI